MNTDTLFNLGVAVAGGQVPKDTKVITALAHSDDPITSYEAAEKMVKSGKLARQEVEVLFEIEWQLKIYDRTDFTAKEIADKWSLIISKALYSENLSQKYYIIQRRLSGLRNKGKIERTGKKRDGYAVWRLV